MSLYASKSNRKFLFVSLAVSAGYWLMSLSEIPKMLSATQSGFPHGVSFGLKLFFSDQTTFINVAYLTTLAILMASLWIKYFGASFTSALRSTGRDPRFTVLIPIILTYVVIWFMSDSFIYRMLILLPALLILISEDLLSQLWAKGLVVGILVAVLSSRLAITTAISSALALIFLFVSIMYSRNRVRN